MNKFYPILLGVLTLQFLVSQGQDTLLSTYQSQLLSLGEQIEAQKPGNTNFMLRGYYHFGFNSSEGETTFDPGSFNPIFLWRQGDRLLFESEWEMEFEDNELEIGLEYTDISYVISKGLIVRAGKFLIPFGTFTERLHPAWINRLTTKPAGFQHHGIGPMDDIGIEIRGGLQAGKSKLNYAFYLVNGPVLNDGTEEAEEAGMLHFENLEDNNKNKAFGGRIGWLPFSNSSLELGASAYFAKAGAEESPFEGDPANEDLNYKDVKVKLTAFDFSYIKSLTGVSGLIDIKAQYNIADVSSATYFDIEDSVRYSYDNNSSAYYAQLSYRPALSANEILKNFEIVGRYSEYKRPDEAKWGGMHKQFAIGLNYWLSWRTAIKFSYQQTEMEQEGMKMSSDQVFLHVAMGF